MTPQLKEALRYIRSLDSQVEVKIAWEALALRQKQISEEKSLEFRVGDLVEFTPKRTGRKTRGIILKKNRTTIQVFVKETNVTWRVSPGLLRLVGKHEKVA
jgi:hypothetical protein